MLKYKGYTGTVEFSEEDNIYFGRVLGIRSLISYEAGTVDELIREFEEAIDSYLEMCKNEGLNPEAGLERRRD